MRRPVKVALLSFPVVALLAAGGCGSSTPHAAQGTGGAAGGSPGSGGQAIGTGGLAGNGRSACLDQPNALPTPPNGQLPCELIPPGLHL
ncbi:MAG TPA: hypothetical protein VMT03_18590 [Polyangia bacterium]|nr:hypothetical protein [Polyangia bacterium]